MHAHETVARVRSLAADGLNPSQIARITGVPRRTIGNWVLGQTRTAALDACRQCGRRAHDFDRLPASYAYLLGVYLGDGMLVRARKGIWVLRIIQDERYPSVIDEIARAVADVMPTNRVRIAPRYRGWNCALISSASKAWPCLFPQHGPGRKHLRKIQLTEWQQGHVANAPGLFLRGLIHSDGCRVVNRVSGGRYAYPRYFFDNESPDIRQLFRDACGLVGVECRDNRRNGISVARRESVARLDEFVGPKR
jgi:hypothetical protein